MIRIPVCLSEVQGDSDQTERNPLCSLEAQVNVPSGR